MGTRGQKLRSPETFGRGLCDLIDKDGEFFSSRVNGKNLKSYHDNTGMFTHFNISN